MSDLKQGKSVYKAKDGYRWRIVAGSDIVAESGEGYSSKAKCENGYRAAVFVMLRDLLGYDLERTK